MKKSVKVLSTILLAIMLVTTIAEVVLAAPDVNATIDNLMNGNANTNQVTQIGGTIVNIIQVVGIVVAVVVILIVGIKYLTSSAEGKAEYKKMMVPYVIGAFLVFAGSSIVKLVYELANSAN